MDSMTHPTDTAKSEELEACPGCGRNGSEDNAIQMAAVSLASFKSAAGGYAFRVECACGFQGPSSLNGGEAIARWNRRSSPPQNDAGGEELREALLEKATWFRCCPSTGEYSGEYCSVRPADDHNMVPMIGVEAVLRILRTPMSELQAWGQEFEAGEAVTSDSADYLHTFYGILNAQGKFWTPLPFNCEESARRHLAKVATGENKSILTTHKIVPVRIRLSALPSAPSGEG